MTKGECERTLRRFHFAAPEKYRTTTFDIEQGPARFTLWVKEAIGFAEPRPEIDWAQHLVFAANAVLAHRERFYRRYLFTKTDEMPTFESAKHAMQVFEEQSPDFGEAPQWGEVILAAFEDSATP